MSYIKNALYFLLNMACGAVSALFILRLLAEACRVDFRNPISQFIYRATNPVLAPIRRLLPNWRRLNIAALSLLWLIMLVNCLLSFVLQSSDHLPRLGGLCLLATTDLFNAFLSFYILVIFLWSLFSWFPQQTYHPAALLLHALVQPVLRPLRGRLVAGNMDFAPWVVMIGLILAKLLLVAPLRDTSLALAKGM